MRRVLRCLREQIGQCKLSHCRVFVVQELEQLFKLSMDPTMGLFAHLLVLSIHNLVVYVWEQGWSWSMKNLAQTLLKPQ